MLGFSPALGVGLKITTAEPFGAAAAGLPSDLLNLTLPFINLISCACHAYLCQYAVSVLAITSITTVAPALLASRAFAYQLAMPLPYGGFSHTV